MTTAIAPERTRIIAPGGEQRQAWLTMVKTACFTVSGNSKGLVTATTVSARLDGLASVQRHDFLMEAERIAAGYDLLTEVEDDGEHLTVRFSRRPELRVITPDASAVAAVPAHEEGAGSPQHAGSLFTFLRRFARAASRRQLEA